MLAHLGGERTVVARAARALSVRAGADTPVGHGAAGSRRNQNCGAICNAGAYCSIRSCVGRRRSALTMPQRFNMAWPSRLRARFERYADTPAGYRRVQRILRLIPGPLAAKYKASTWRRLDDERAAALVPPPEERLQTRLVWVAEAYAPSDVPQLLEGLRHYGLDETGLASSERTTHSIRTTRGRPGIWSYGPLSMLRRSGEGSAFFHQVQTKLPDGVTAALPSLFGLPGSLTLLVFCFLLDDRAAGRMHETVGRTYRTTAHRHGHGWSFQPPEMAQQTATREALRDQRAELSAWVAQRLPGLFTRLANEAMPAAELVTYRTAEAMHRNIGRKWPSSVEVGFHGRRWRSERWPAISMTTATEDQVEEWVLRLSGREQAVRPARDEHDKPLDEEAGWWLLFQRLHHSFDGLVALHTIHSAFDLFSRRLADIRDVAGFRGARPRRASRQLERMAADFRLAADARAVAADIREADTPAHIFSAWDGGDWQVVDPLDRLPSERGWIAGMAEWLPKRADAVLSSEHRVRERLVAEAQFVTAGAGLRLQRTAAWVASFALIFAIAAVAVAVLQFVKSS